MASRACQVMPGSTSNTAWTTPLIHTTYPMFDPLIHRKGPPIRTEYNAFKQIFCFNFWTTPWKRGNGQQHSLASNKEFAIEHSGNIFKGNFQLAMIAALIFHYNYSKRKLKLHEKRRARWLNLSILMNNNQFDLTRTLSMGRVKYNSTHFTIQSRQWGTKIKHSMTQICFLSKNKNNKKYSGALGIKM